MDVRAGMTGKIRTRSLVKGYSRFNRVHTLDSIELHTKFCQLDLSDHSELTKYEASMIKFIITFTQFELLHAREVRFEDLVDNIDIFYHEFFAKDSDINIHNDNSSKNFNLDYLLKYLVSDLQIISQDEEGNLTLNPLNLAKYLNLKSEAIVES